MIPKATSFGYLPDLEDRRDFNALTFRTYPEAIKDRVDHRNKVVILDQDALGSCVTHGTFGAIQLKHRLEGIPQPKLGNRLHAYWGARKYIGTEDWDSGSHIRDAFRFMNKVGYMPEDETVHGYDITKFREPPTPEEQRLMFDQKQKGEGQVEYIRVYETGEARREALMRLLSNDVIPVVGTDTTREFLNYSGGILQKPKEGTPSTGGHAFYLCGYDEDCVYGANSWSRFHGEDGILRLEWEYMYWARTRDIWGVAKAPYYSHLLS